MLDKKAKKIQVAAKAIKNIEEKTKRNLENAIEKIQNLKHKTALISTSKSFEKKDKKKLLLVKKAYTTKNPPVKKAYIAKNLPTQKANMDGR